MTGIAGGVDRRRTRILAFLPVIALPLLLPATAWALYATCGVCLVVAIALYAQDHRPWSAVSRKARTVLTVAVAAGALAGYALGAAANNGG